MSPLQAGNVYIGVKVMDDDKIDTTLYVKRADYAKLREQLREAKAEIEEWEERYWDLLSECGGTTSP